jgi:hypothetical protein
MEAVPGEGGYRINDLDASGPQSQQGSEWGRRRYHHVSGGAQAATGVGRVRGGMEVSDLNRQSEDQQERTAKGKGYLPGVPELPFG